MPTEVMIDPIGIVGTVGATAQIADQIIEIGIDLHYCAKRYRNAHGDVKRVSRQLGIFSDSVHLVETTVRHFSKKKLPIVSSDQCISLALKMEEECKDIKNQGNLLLDKFEPLCLPEHFSMVTRIWAGIRWMSKKQEIPLFQAQIHAATSALNLMVLVFEINNKLASLKNTNASAEARREM